MPRNNFNSIKVQLELSAALEQLNVEPFQFHKGTIRTVKPNRLCLLIWLFQFHKGTIRTPVLIRCTGNSVHFNSIKVQLELLFLIMFMIRILISIP